MKLNIEMNVKDKLNVEIENDALINEKEDNFLNKSNASITLKFLNAKEFRRFFNLINSSKKISKLHVFRM